MTIPSLVFSICVASLLGSTFHTWKGGGFGYLFFYLLLSNVGFFGGHYLASFLGWNFLSLGPLNFGIALVFSLIFLFTGNWLSRVNVE